MQERSKDPMILVRSTIRGKNSKGGDRIQLYLSPEETQKLIETLAANVDLSPSGVKLDLHTNKKEYQGRTFDSSFAFVKSVEAKDGAVSGKASATPQKFVPVAAAPEAVSDKVAAIKRNLKA